MVIKFRYVIISAVHTINLMIHTAPGVKYFNDEAKLACYRELSQQRVINI